MGNFLTKAIRKVEQKISDSVVNKTAAKTNLSAVEKARLKTDFDLAADPLLNKTAKIGTGVVIAAGLAVGGVVLAPVLGPLAAGGGAAAGGSGVAAAGGGGAVAAGGGGGLTALLGGAKALLKTSGNTGIGGSTATGPLTQTNMSLLGDTLKKAGATALKTVIDKVITGPLSEAAGTKTEVKMGALQVAAAPTEKEPGTGFFDAIANGGILIIGAVVLLFLFGKKLFR